jgi:hypothetical protein
MDIIVVLGSVALCDDGYAELVRLNLRDRIGSFVSSCSNAWDVIDALLRQNVRLGAAQVAFASLDGTIRLTEIGRGLRTVRYE